MFGTDCSTADLAYRPRLMLTKGALLSVVPDHFSRCCLENLAVRLAGGKHLHGHYGDMQQLNTSHIYLVMTTKNFSSFSSDHFLRNPGRRNRDGVLHLKLRRQ